MKLRMLATVCALLTACTLFAEAEKPAIKGAEVGKWTMDIDAAKTLAKETNKPLFINFTGSDWCGWCKMMDKQIFSTTEWQDYAKQNLVLLWIDFPKNKDLIPKEFMPRNRKFAKKFNVQGYPTYVVLAPDGETVLGQLGADQDITPADFAERIDQTLVMNELDKWLTAEEIAAIKKLDEEIKTLDAEIIAWQEKAMAEGKAFQEKMEALHARRGVLIQKAAKAAKQ